MQDKKEQISATNRVFTATQRAQVRVNGGIETVLETELTSKHLNRKPS